MMSSLVTVAVGVVLFFAGLDAGMPVLSAVHAASLVVVVMLVVSWQLAGNKLKLPKDWWIYSLFLLILAISINTNSLIGIDSWLYWWLFFNAGLWWVAGFNVGQLKKDYGMRLLVALAVGYLVVGVYRTWFGGSGGSLLSLAGGKPFPGSHRHIGDIWALIGIVGVDYWLKRKPIVAGLLIAFSMVVMMMSFSRSAVLAFIIGAVYVFRRPKRWLLIVGILLFLGVSSFKPTLGVREYYIQAILGLWQYPQGVGMGNFYKISQNPIAKRFGLGEGTQMAHNLVFEILAGMGWWGWVYVVWLALAYRRVFDTKDQGGRLNRALLIGFGVLFMLDYVYLNPTMLWLWSGLLGVNEACRSS